MFVDNQSAISISNCDSWKDQVADILRKIILFELLRKKSARQGGALKERVPRLNKLNICCFNFMKG